MTTGDVRLDIADGIAAVVFDRPQARNAMTWPMYDRLTEACGRIAADPSVRVATFRGAGGEAFVAGTDIAQFAAFRGAEDGLAYERKIDAVIGSIERLPVPTIAVIDGPAMGGGLAIALACDLRAATPEARFGVPIARTVGNCLSMANTARLVAAFGIARAKRMLLLAEILTVDDLRITGFVQLVAARADLDSAVEGLCARLKCNAPVSMRAGKEAVRRLAAGHLPDGDDLIRTVYGSADFRAGVAAFIARKRPEWQGR